MLQKGYNDMKTNPLGDYNLNQYGQIETPSWQESNYINEEPDIKNVSHEIGVPASTVSAPTSPVTITAPPALPNNPFLDWFGIKTPIAPLSASKVAQIKAAMGTSGVGSWFDDIAINVGKFASTLPIRSAVKPPVLNNAVAVPSKSGSWLQWLHPPVVKRVAMQSGSLLQWLHPPVAATKVVEFPESVGLQTTKPEGNFTYENIKRTVGMSGLGDFDWGSLTDAISTVASDFKPQSPAPAPTPTTVVVQQPASSKSNMEIYLLVGGGVLAVGIALAIALRSK